MCENDPPVVPLCVQVCRVDALTYEEYEEDVPEVIEVAKPGKIEAGLETLVDEFGWDKVMDIMARMAKKG
jgi:benzoyl-CoA reductase subunit BamC